MLNRNKFNFYQAEGETYGETMSEIKRIITDYVDEYKKYGQLQPKKMKLFFHLSLYFHL